MIVAPATGWLPTGLGRTEPSGPVRWWLSSTRRRDWRPERSPRRHSPRYRPSVQARRSPDRSQTASRRAKVARLGMPALRSGLDAGHGDCCGRGGSDDDLQCHRNLAKAGGGAWPDRPQGQMQQQGSGHGPGQAFSVCRAGGAQHDSARGNQRFQKSGVASDASATPVMPVWVRMIVPQASTAMRPGPMGAACSV